MATESLKKSQLAMKGMAKQLTEMSEPVDIPRKLIMKAQDMKGKEFALDFKQVN